MKLFRLIAIPFVLATLLAPTMIRAQTVGNPYVVTLCYRTSGTICTLAGPSEPIPSSIGQSSTDGSTTQTTGGVAQVLFGGATPPNGFKVAIPSAIPSTTPCWLSDTTTTPSATTAGSYPVFPQGQWSTEPGEKAAGPVYINCPTTGEVVSAKRW